MESARDYSLSRDAAQQRIDDQCSMAISTCFGMMDAAESIGVTNELHATLDALLRILAASSLSANRPIQGVRH
ncbi:hypothetical protein AWB64_01271 [Caballeronia sordidicola]|uniref:Uncharacterized protein n=1 Tax=Caballeronia sordidicola TaxID=196367 RepID=A0A158FFP2_CABSO|nr:hypothetical protein AWB64_01271 [Caballeronia sordidicola]